MWKVFATRVLEAEVYLHGSAVFIPRVQRPLRFNSDIRKSQERTQRAMMVSVGFWQGLDVKPEASITKRFLMSWVC